MPASRNARSACDAVRLAMPAMPDAGNRRAELQRDRAAGGAGADHGDADRAAFALAQLEGGVDVHVTGPSFVRGTANDYPGPRWQPAVSGQRMPTVGSSNRSPRTDAGANSRGCHVVESPMRLRASGTPWAHIGGT